MWMCSFNQQSNDSRVSFRLMVGNQNNIMALYQTGKVISEQANRVTLDLISLRLVINQRFFFSFLFFLLNPGMEPETKCSLKGKEIERESAQTTHAVKHVKYQIAHSE